MYKRPPGTYPCLEPTVQQVDGEYEAMVLYADMPCGLNFQPCFDVKNSKQLV